MLVVDSSVWIAFFHGAPRPAAEVLAQLLEAGEVRLVVPDLVLFEVLRGFRSEHDLRAARRLMEALSIEPVLEPGESHRLALAATEHDRSLRQRGLTVRSPVDVLVATFCIERDYALLHDDRDFDGFAQWRGLRVWRP